MANEKLTQLPQIGSPTTGTLFYMVDGGTSWNGSFNQMANFMIFQYGLGLASGSIDGGDFINSFTSSQGIDGGSF